MNAKQLVLTELRPQGPCTSLGIRDEGFYDCLMFNASGCMPGRLPPHRDQQRRRDEGINTLPAPHPLPSMTEEVLLLAPFPIASCPLPPIPAAVKQPREIDSTLKCSQSPALSGQGQPLAGEFSGPQVQGNYGDRYRLNCPRSSHLFPDINALKPEPQRNCIGDRALREVTELK